MYTFSPMMVANSRKHHCRVRPYTREVLVLSTNLEIQTKHYSLVFRNRRGMINNQEMYIRGKPNGKLIWKSIQNGPTPHPMITDPPTTDSAASPRQSSTTSIKQALERKICENVECSWQGSDLYSLKASSPHAKRLSQETGASTSMLIHWPKFAHDKSAPFFITLNVASPQPTAQSPMKAFDATMTQLLNLLSGSKAVFHPPTTSSGLPSNSRLMLRVHDVTLLLNLVQRRLQVIMEIQVLEASRDMFTTAERETCS
ncbi:hypothetical protein Tco_0891994 [Tanacetum coccineum]|uniref:Uncharacterized protein n=1 Tax=Tanacetum coccineum TaxID=301880 RepID=A0ABQ5C6G5_9ASTR